MELERRNAYFCQSCRKVTITVDVAEGVTPMFIQCPHCEKEMASSFMYQVPGCMRMTTKEGKMVTLPADYEWYKPDAKTKLHPQLKDHVKQGGLLMRPRTDAKAITLKLKS